MDRDLWFDRDVWHLNPYKRSFFQNISIYHIAAARLFILSSDIDRYRG